MQPDPGVHLGRRASTSLNRSEGRNPVNKSAVSSEPDNITVGTYQEQCIDERIHHFHASADDVFGCQLERAAHCSTWVSFSSSKCTELVVLTDKIPRQNADDACRRDCSVAEDLAPNAAETASSEGDNNRHRNPRDCRVRRSA